MEWARGATIGRGSSATVSLAIISDNLLAAKSAPLSTTSPLQHEESILTVLQDCPHIISSFGHDVTVESDGQRLYNLFLEYVPGGSLAKFCGSLPESAVKRYTRSILEGLAFVHRRGYVHCDIKPQNILISGGKDVKIADFGLAKKRFEKTECSVRGSPLYMSPESVARKEYEAPMDIWSLGCVVAEMGTGRPSWGQSRPDDVWGLMMRIGFGDELPEIPAEMSEEGKDFLRKCFVRDPEMRWTADMLLKHPFVAGLKEDEVELQRMSPRSVFGYSRCDDASSSSSCSMCCYEDSHNGDDRIGILTTGEVPESWGCESCDGWIRVRGEISSSSSGDLIEAAKERIGLLSRNRPDWWCSSSPMNDGWISVREDCFSDVEAEIFS